MLNKNRTAKKRAFTLVEIMVTMAILVVMMSFLFQYVIGAQRIFTSSNRQAMLFDDAQIVLGLMENDLQNMVVSNEPGREIPMFYDKRTDGSKKYHILMMVTSGESSKLSSSDEETLVGYYLVVYCYSEEDEKLYRVAIDNKNALGPTLNLKPWEFYGLDFVGDATESDRNNFITKYASGMMTKMTSEYEIMDAVSDFRIIPLNNDDFVTTAAAFNKGIAKVRPDAIKLELTLYDAEKVPKELPDDRQEELKKENSRLFSKVIFFNDMR